MYVSIIYFLLKTKSRHNAINNILVLYYYYLLFHFLTLATITNYLVLVLPGCYCIKLDSSDNFSILIKWF